MKICLLNSHPKYLMGGAELFMYYCAKEFVRLGHEVDMVSVYPRGHVSVPIPGMLETLEGLRIHHLAGMATDPGSVRRFLKTLEAIPTDVYLKMYTDPSTVLLSGYAQYKHRPYVLFMAHDAHCAADAGLDSSPLAYAARYRVSAMTKFVMLRLGAYAWSLRRATRLLVQNPRQHALVKQNFGLEAAEDIPIGHPIPQELPPKSQPPFAMWNARFQPWKRPEIFLELARRLPQHQFVLSGPTADDQQTAYYKQIEAQAMALPNMMIVPFPSSFDQFVSFPLFGRASLFIDTIETGGFENTLIQAWLRKVPVVSLSRDFDGALEREGLGKACGGDMDRLVATVDRLLTDQAERQALGERCFAYANQQYNIVPIAARLLHHLQLAAATVSLS